MECADPKVTTTITLDPALRDRLDRSAAATERSRSWLVAKALTAFLPPLGGEDIFSSSAAATSGAHDARNAAGGLHQAHPPAHSQIVPDSFLDGLKRSPRVSNDAELKAAQARALAQALAADAACRIAAQQSPALRVPPKEDK